MLDDFQPRRRPSPNYTPRGGTRPGQNAPEGALPGFRTESVLPQHAGDDLMPNLQRKNPGPAGPYRPNVPAPEPRPQYRSAAPVGEELPEEPAAPSKKRSKKKKFALALLVVLLLAAIGFAAWWFGFRDTEPEVANNSETVQVTEEEEDTEPVSNLVASPLSGADVDPALAARPVTAIMIENSGDARPQSGLREADVVFEAIAEGGITRFLALFQSKTPDYIGPIRSARPYYVEWAATFNASYVHAGGSPDGLQRIKDLGVRDINAFAYGEDVFYRTSDRFAPHNLYSSFKGLDSVNTAAGYTNSTFTPWGRKQDTPQTPAAKSIDINISAPFYNPHYDYDPAENNYKRSEGGEAHVDEKTGKQLAPFVVLVMVMERGQNGIYSVYKTTGSGQFIVFQDGVRSEGTWSRAGATDQYVFKDKYGFDFKFNKGQTWVSIVTAASDVTSAP